MAVEPPAAQRGARAGAGAPAPAAVPVAAPPTRRTAAANAEDRRHRDVSSRRRSVSASKNRGRPRRPRRCLRNRRRASFIDRHRRRIGRSRPSRRVRPAQRRLRPARLAADRRSRPARGRCRRVRRIAGPSPSAATDAGRPATAAVSARAPAVAARFAAAAAVSAAPRHAGTTADAAFVWQPSGRRPAP